MPISEYDAIITNFGGTNFTAYYKKGISLKLSDNTTVISIYKPEMLEVNKYYDPGVFYKDAMIELSGNDKNLFHYQDLKKLQSIIEEAIDFLNKENENLIDRSKECTYETIKKSPLENRETSAIKYADLEIGGIYKDNKDKEWIFFGEAEIFKDNVENNRSGSRYIYMPNTGNYEKIGDNWFKCSKRCEIDSYASKKRFFKKVGQLEIMPNKSITFVDEFNFCAVYNSSTVDKNLNEEKINKIVTARNTENEQIENEYKRIQNELIEKITKSNEKSVLTIDFSEDETIRIKLSCSGNVDEYSLKLIPKYKFYLNRLLFWPILSTFSMKNSESLESINQVIKKHENNDEMCDYVADSDKMSLIIKNQSVDFIDSVQRNINSYISDHETEFNKRR